MQFIDKEHPVYEREGNRIVDSFITGCWQKESNKHAEQIV